MLSKENQPAGWNRHESIIQIISMMVTGNGIRSAKIQWYASNAPMFHCTDATDDEWELFDKAFKADKRILVAAPRNLESETMPNFHDSYLEILA